MSDSDASYIEMLEMEQQNLSRNSNGHNFSHGGPIQAHHIWGHSKLNSRRFREIQIVINFHSDVPFRRIYIETLKIEQRNLSRNPNIQNFSHEGPIQAHHIWRHSKLNNGGSREIQMVITFHTEVLFRRIIYRDAQN